MDATNPSTQPVRLPFQGPHRPPTKEGADPCKPFWLILRPGRLAIEVTRSDIVLGRHAKADIRFPLPEISRQHCRFLFTEDHWEVVDLQSLNGVFVNDQRVQQAELHHGDYLRLASVILEIDLVRELTTATLLASELDGSTGALRQIVESLLHPLQNVTRPQRRAS